MMSRIYRRVNHEFYDFFFLIAGGVVLVGIVAVIAFFVSCAILTAWEYAKSPRAQMTKKSLDTRMKGEWYG